MSAFSPDVPPIPRIDQAITLARTVPTALRRTPSVAKIWYLRRRVIRGVLTAGYWPCRALHVRLGDTLTMQARQCEMAADLLARHLPPDDAGPITEAARNVDVSHREIAISSLLMFASLASAAVWLTQHGLSKQAFEQWWLHAPANGDGLAWASAGLLCLAYLALVIQMNRQLVAWQQFALAFNAACGERTEPIEPPPLVWGVRPGSVVAGLLMAYDGWVWALPMMLAWAAFETFAHTAARGVRVQLAERLTVISGVEPVVPTADVCPNPQCRNSVPIDAQFCPRCGAAV